MGSTTTRLKMRRALGASLALVIVLGSVAAAEQMSARDKPVVKGPLELAGSGCGGGPVRHEAKVIARVQSCVRIYQFDDVMETDPARTYGVAWIQSTVDPERGWCVTKANTDLELPDGVARHGRAPARRIDVTRTRRLKVKLTADADGHALEEASVAQTMTAYRGSLNPSSADDGNVLRLTWTGRQPRKLAFVMGAEISWEFLSAPELRGGLGKLRFLKSKRCRP